MDWHGVEQLLHHAFYNELRVAPEEHPVILADQPNWNKAEREKMMSILFETFNCPAVFLQSSPVLSLYASGRSTGLSVSIGDELITVVPVYEGKLSAYINHFQNKLITLPQLWVSIVYRVRSFPCGPKAAFWNKRSDRFPHEDFNRTRILIYHHR